MLTPMILQYLVGLCCLKANPESVEVMLGDLVEDIVAEKCRDVDVTVTFKDESGKITAFKAFEVKKENTPLDVSEVEQLCMKFYDMHDISYKAIVSFSGFSEAAIKKAKGHDVDLFVLKPWFHNKSLETKDDMWHPESANFTFSTALLCWINHSLFLKTKGGPSAFELHASTPIYNKRKKKHSKNIANFNELREFLLLKSTGLLFNLKPVEEKLEIMPFEALMYENGVKLELPWEHSHTIDIEKDGFHLCLGDEYVLVESVTISGQLQWQKQTRSTTFYMLENVFTALPYAGAMLAEAGNHGQLQAMIISPNSSEVKFHPVNILPKHKNFIQKLSLTNQF